MMEKTFGRIIARYFSRSSFELVTSDFMGPVKESRAGNINIIVLVDHKKINKLQWNRIQ
jgi:hypothetical protein